MSLGGHDDHKKAYARSGVLGSAYSFIGLSL